MMLNVKKVCFLKKSNPEERKKLDRLNFANDWFLIIIMQHSGSKID